MKKYSFLFKTMVLVFFVFLSCSKEANSDEEKLAGTTVTEDKQNLKSSIDDFHSCIKTYGSGTLADLIFESVKKMTIKETVTQGNFTYESQDSWMGYILGKFEDTYGDFNDGFKFSEFKGKYIWDSADKKWNKETSDVVEIYFASEKEKITNDAKIVVDVYESKVVFYDGKEKTVPLKTHIYGEIDGEKMVELTLKDVDIDVKTNFSMPLKFNAEVFVKPHKMDISFKRITPTEFDFYYSMNSSSSCGFDVKANIQTKTSDYGNFTSFENDFKKVKGYYKYQDLKINFNVDVSKIGSLGKDIDDLSQNEINSVLDADVEYKNKKIADLFYNKSVEKIPFELIFKDGTKEEVTKYTGDFEQKVRDIFKRFIEDE